ncbi:Ankyrin repeat-containing domain protein [Rhypophila decipiens]
MGGAFDQYPPDDILDLLRAFGADFFHRTNPGGKLLLHFAARDDCLPVARALLDADEDPDARTTFHGLTPLHIAADYGSPGLAALLLDRGDVDVDAAHTVGTFNHFDWDCLTPLAMAALRPQSEMVHLLTTEGIKGGRMRVLARPPSHHTVLNLAVTEPNPAMLKMLLEKFKAACPERSEPLPGDAATTASTSTTYTEVINYRAAGDMTALHLCAAQVGRDEHLRLLLDNDGRLTMPSLNALTESGHSVLDVLCATRERLRSWREEWLSLLRLTDSNTREGSDGDDDDDDASNAISTS